MSEPRTVTTTTDWRAIAGPEQCQCGHEHYGRTPGGSPHVAPQWGFCEDPDCDCRGLRREASS